MFNEPQRLLKPPGDPVHEETTLLVEAIESLNQESNYFKDYAFPIASALFTSLLGAGIAYFTLRYQEGIKIEKEKMDSSNKWTLQVESAQSTLIVIKSNYHGKLTDRPFQRLWAIPTILIPVNPIIGNYQNLSFILSTNNEKKPEFHKWSQIPRIRTMINNYNYLFKLWDERNIMTQAFKDQIEQHHGGKTGIMISIEDAVVVIGQAKLARIIDLNERVIKLTDDIIKELGSFLDEFPNYVKTKIQIKRLKKYGSIFTFSNNENQMLLNLIEKSPEVDFISVESVFGDSSENIKKRHITGYE